MRRHTSFSTISPPPRPIGSYGPFDRIQADIVDMEPGKKRSLFMTNNRGQYPPRTLFGTQQVRAYSFPYMRQGKVKLQHFLSRTLFGKQQVRGKQCTVFLTSRQEKSSYSIFPLVLYSAQSRFLRVNRAQFFLHQARKN